MKLGLVVLLALTAQTLGYQLDGPGTDADFDEVFEIEYAPRNLKQVKGYLVTMEKVLSRGDGCGAIVATCPVIAADEVSTPPPVGGNNETTTGTLAPIGTATGAPSKGTLAPVGTNAKTSAPTSSKKQGKDTKPPKSPKPTAAPTKKGATKSPTKKAAVVSTKAPVAVVDTKGDKDKPANLTSLAKYGGLNGVRDCLKQKFALVTANEKCAKDLNKMKSETELTLGDIDTLFSVAQAKVDAASMLGGVAAGAGLLGLGMLGYRKKTGARFNTNLRDLAGSSPPLNDRRSRVSGKRR